MTDVLGMRNLLRVNGAVKVLSGICVLPARHMCVAG
jgi:hypothetical protein